MKDSRNIKLSERLQQVTTTIQGKEYIGIVNGNQITAVEVVEILNDGFVAKVVGDPTDMVITYPIIPFAVISKELEKIIIKKLDEMKKQKDENNVITGKFN